MNQSLKSKEKKAATRPAFNIEEQQTMAMPPRQAQDCVRLNREQTEETKSGQIHQEASREEIDADLSDAQVLLLAHQYAEEKLR